MKHQAGLKKKAKYRIESIPVELEKSGTTLSTTAYFIRTKTIKFRHKGIIDETPPYLRLKDLTQSNLSKQVLVYYSASGSGKTSELVGSAATRGADLAFVLSAEDPSPESYGTFEENADELIAKDRHKKRASLGGEMEASVDGDDGHAKSATEEENDSQEEEDSVSDEEGDNDLSVKQFKERYVNRSAADMAIKDGGLSAMIKAAKSQIKPIVEAATQSKQRLKLVLAIDEAKSCPHVIRGILRFPKYMKTLVRDVLKDNGMTIDKRKFSLLISVGGTGVASSTMGSLPRNFSILKPYHEDNWKAVINSNLKQDPLDVMVTWSPTAVTIKSIKDILDHYPVLAELMKNGRVASIALEELRKCSIQRKEVLEGPIANACVKQFMASNGMNPIADQPEEQKIAASAALAVHLFGENDDFDMEVPQNQGEVATWASQMDFFKFSADISVKTLVGTYGLLEPSRAITDNDQGKKISPPLKMTMSQQLIAAFMLGLGLDSMLQQSWFGFELMSTHFVKCAIAASVLVHKKKRPSIMYALSCLGFQVNEGVTDDSVIATWDKLDDLCAASTLPKSDRTVYHDRTRQLNVGLKINKGQGGANGKKPTLQIERVLLHALTNSVSRIRHFGAPIACVNEGKSKLADGMVTFFAFKRPKDTSSFNTPGLS
ncbi:expressed unknown protein [Seminavis robusta]|uniref:Uncharacterized protein n=1 Tax=Seminavis robusta TaxID=568900 RepID=A0A9N8EWP7_9STRA|nr:expressed unknown protein [Seminavis robusta]|eukprot:Sro2277_g321740.1 n/a (660) ;mRNA; f:12831-14810